MAQAADAKTPTVGDRILTTDKKKGEIVFIGPVAGKKGTFYGVKLDDKSGKNNGTVAKVAYFKAKDKCGIFVTKEKISKTKPGPNNAGAPRVTVGSRVRVKSKKSDGTIMYIGTPAFKPGIWYGVKLDEAKGKNNGTVGGRKYFTCKDKFGTFVQAAQIESLGNSNNGKSGKKKKSTKKKTEKPPVDEPKAKSPKAADVEYAVGDKVMIKPNRKGQIRWMGEEKEFGIGQWFGIRLSEDRGDCDGEFKDIRKFRCPEGYGAFVQQKLMIKKLTDEEGDFDFMNEEQKYEEKEEAVQKEIQDKKDKMRQIKDHFKSADKDGDADIDREEWGKMCKDLWPDMTEEQSQVLFKSIDISESGEISFAEFTAYIEKIGGVDNLLSDPHLKEDNEDNKDDNNEDNNEDNKDDGNNDAPAEDAGDDNNDGNENEAEPEAEAEAEVEQEPEAEAANDDGGDDKPADDEPANEEEAGGDD